MIGLMQIMIYLFCVYLVYKGIEIFQIAYMSTRENRRIGLTIGIVLTIGAILISGLAIYMTENIANHISNKNIPNF